MYLQQLLQELFTALLLAFLTFFNLSAVGVQLPNIYQSLFCKNRGQSVEEISAYILQLNSNELHTFQKRMRAPTPWYVICFTVLN